MFVCKNFDVDLIMKNEFKIYLIEGLQTILFSDLLFLIYFF